MLTLPIPDTADPPEWIELIPQGPVVTGADGRRWLNDSQNTILAAFAARNRPMVIDWEHASEHRAPVGLDAPAAGWIDRIEVRAGAIWAHVERWTERAAAMLKAGEYRYVSPVFNYEKETGRIRELTSIGLTNQPNLPLQALNQRDWSGQLSEPSLTPEEREAARLFGRTEADLLAAKKALSETARNAIVAESRLTADERRVCELMGTSTLEFIASKEKYNA